ncbi:glucan endo-1,3-beta-glucosidase 3 isoform X1 [Canna indica]|uniref:Glucan endo-1,3-beta-glucosidase 3 isoform X1 n=1 Tax=Canna indica TaxID=4628 RepID=A0AAQ3QNB6_9LILI|nr:glucan endo-1,3-beta-glucosidase 3 isoform X1 [Canna indica]
MVLAYIYALPVSQWFHLCSLAFSAAACFLLYHTFNFPSPAFPFPHKATTHFPHLSLALLPPLPFHNALFYPICCRDQLVKREVNHSTPPNPLMARARGVFAQSFLFPLLVLGLHTVCSSGTSVGFSYDARKDIVAPLSAQRALLKILVANPGAGDYLGSLRSTNISVNLFMRDIEAKELFQSKLSATSWLNKHLIDTPPSLSLDSIIVNSSGQALPSLLSTLYSIGASLKTFSLDKVTKISVMFSLSNLESLQRTHHKSLHRLMQILRSWDSPVVVEALVDGQEMILSDDFVRLTIEKAFSVCSLLPQLDVSIILVVKISVNPSPEAIAKFSDNVLKLLRSDALLSRRIAKLFIDISHLRQVELMFPSLHIEIVNHGRELITATKATAHDVFTPVTNPVTAPITIPSTNPTPGVVTVPSTNPATAFPTNPTMSPVTIPPMNPISTPITVPATNPFPTPSTTPVVPVTNPATTPSTYPTNPPFTNPVTTYPFTPPTTTPSTIPPVTVPSTVPVTPAISGQTWCVAKAGATDEALQLALDYACGLGGADCSAIQQTGSCYNPDTLQTHASYAFNSYYQKNPVATSCDFGGSAMLVNVNPSTGTCIFPSSSSSLSSSIPASTTTTSSGGSTPGSVLNSNSPIGPNSVFGSDNPTSSVSGALSLSVSWTLLVVVLTVSLYQTISCNI